MYGWKLDSVSGQGLSRRVEIEEPELSEWGVERGEDWSLAARRQPLVGSS